MEELYEHHIPADYSLSETIFGSEYEGTYSDRPFLWRAFSSHLQTHCRTVVLGHDLHTVNIFINSLALLMPLAQRKCSRRARKDTFRKNLNVFYPEAFVQGLILTVRAVMFRGGGANCLLQPDTDRASILQDMHALESPFPVTVVDLTRQLVEQTEVLSAYSRTRDECFKDELQNEHTAETAASLIACALLTFIYDATTHAGAQQRSVPPNKRVCALCEADDRRGVPPAVRAAQAAPGRV